MRRLRGFTMIELLVVIAIIAILATGAIGMYVNAQTASRNAKRRSDMKDFQNALEQYYGDKQEYPSSPNCDELTQAGADYFKSNIEPAESRSGHDAYVKNCSSSSYCVCAHLEEVGKDVGNSSSDACNFVSNPGNFSSAEYYCVTNLQ